MDGDPPPNSGPVPNPGPPPVNPEGGQLFANLMHFARVLRSAGLPVGPGQVLAAMEAVRAVGVTNREDFYWTMHAVFVNRRDQREIFDQAFHVFWRNPRILERVMAMALPQTNQPEGEDSREEMLRRIVDALKAPGDGEAPKAEEEIELEFDATLTYSAEEVLRGKDFEKMTTAELEQAKRAIARLRLPVLAAPTRRFRPDPAGNRIDMRTTLRRSLRGGGQSIPIVTRKRRTRRPPLVVICDISGSMARYSRMLLHFLHALTNDRDRVFTFLFGTRLTNVTRYLRYKDVDDALEKVGEACQDWEGGTRIGACLHDFNIHWSRRVLGQGAVVLVITDGLDRDGGVGLDREMERLHKSARRTIWLNPLLRYEGFAPKSMGIRAMLPHVDEFRTVHSLDSLAALADILSGPAEGQDRSVKRWLPMLQT